MIKRILVIIQRSNGDVLLSLPLINSLINFYQSPKIDLLVNDDTYQIARLIPNINSIYQFSYKKKTDKRFKQEKDLISNIFRKYDLSINLTASDRSVIYSLMASKKSISAVEKENKKSWWKKLLLKHYYHFDYTNHIVQNNLQPLKYLGISTFNNPINLEISSTAVNKVKSLLRDRNVKDYIIFHPSAQYKYKIYPENLRHTLLKKLSNLGTTIIVTGSRNKIDLDIKKSLEDTPNIIDFIGETSLEEYIALSSFSIGYIGMDTLNMHIASLQNKRIFAIFGPTILSTWSPWSNELKESATQDIPLQTYGNCTIFQANMECVACGKAGCNNSGISECLNNIDPNIVFEEVKNWHINRLNSENTMN